MDQKKIVLPLIILTLLCTQCNILDWTTTSENETFYDGLKLFNNQQFTAAKEKFAEAVKSDSMNSEYRYYHAKAVIFESGINYFTIARRLIKFDTSNMTGLNLPFYSKEEDMTPAQDNVFKNTLYQAASETHNDLEPIFLKKTHGEIDLNYIAFDFSIISLARAILQLRDTNNDNQIDDEDLYITIEKHYNPQTGEYYYLPDFVEILTYIQQGHAEELNQMLKNTVKYSAEGIIAMTNVITADTTLFDNADVTKIIENIDSLGNLYMINDGIDNDNDGRIDEESLNKKDDDGDGLMDEDTHL
jgi:hypothetical protein